MAHQIFARDGRSATDHFPGIGRYVSNLAQAFMPNLADDEHLLIPPNDLTAMVTQITTLLDHEKRRMRLGQNGRKRIENHFTIQQTAAKISDIYQQILTNE